MSALVEAAPDLLASCQETETVLKIAMNLLFEADMGDVFEMVCHNNGVKDGFGVRLREAIAKALSEKS